MLAAALEAAGGISEKLRRRRLEVLPLTGAGAAFTELQGRGPGESTSAAALADLISSISAVGVLQPVLIEETVTPDGAVTRLVIAGERRLRACRFGATADPDNPHFHGLPAVICPGPLSEDERRTWQLIENLAREDLQPGELAAALLLERCALLTVRLRAAAVPLPGDLERLDDPVTRWTALERSRTRSGAHHVGASWEDTLRRLGLQIQPRRARQLVEAFRALPRQISTDMDAAKVSLATRCAYARLHNGRREAADGLWEAVRARQAAALLPRAVRELIADPEMSPDAALHNAQAAADDGNAARAAANRRPRDHDRDELDDGELVDVDELQGVVEDVDEPCGKSKELAGGGQLVGAALVEQTLAVLCQLTAELARGAQLPPYAGGSLVLAIADLTQAGDLARHQPAAGDGHRRNRDLASSGAAL